MRSAPVLAQELGADEAIDYTKQQFDEALKGSPVDAVIDMMGGALPRTVVLCCTTDTLVSLGHGQCAASTCLCTSGMQGLGACKG